MKLVVALLLVAALVVPRRHNWRRGRDGLYSTPIMAATRTIGLMHEFFPERETVTAYLERFQLFVSANSIEDDKVVATVTAVTIAIPV